MAEIIVPGPISGRNYGFKIKGDTPTVDERQWIDGRIRQQESSFQEEYAARFGAPVETGESEGVGNYIGEIPKGIARGAVGGLETAALFATPYLPEDILGVPVRDPYREGVRSLAYSMKPQADLGLESTIAGKSGEALGSFLPLVAAAAVTRNPTMVRGMAAAMGGGEAVERAISEGASIEDQRKAGLMGAGVGILGAVVPERLARAIKGVGEPTFITMVDRVRRAATEGGFEGATEVAENIAQNLIQQGLYDPSQGTFTGTGEAFGYGAGVGAFVKGIIDLALPGKAPVAAPEVPPAEPEAPPAVGLTPPPPPNEGQAQEELSGAQSAEGAPAPIANPAVQEIDADPQLRAAVDAIERTGKATVKTIQDALGIKGSAALPIMARLEKLGVVSKFANGKRTIAIPPGLSVQSNSALGAAEVEVEPAIKAEPSDVPKATVTATSEVEVPSVNEAQVKANVPPVEEAPSAPASAEVDRVMKVLQKAREQQAAGKNQLASKSGVKSLVNAGLIAPEDALLAPTAMTRVADLLALGPEEVSRRITKRLTPPAQETANVKPLAEAEPAAMGTGITGGSQDVAVEPVNSDGAAAAGAIASEGEGLGRSVSVPVDTGVPEGSQPAALRGTEEQLNIFEALPTTGPRPAPVRSVEQIMRDTAPSTEQQLNLDFIPPYDAGVGAARQRIPGTIVPVDKATLQPTGKPRMESSDVYAPSRTAPGRAPTAPGTVLTGSPTELQIRDEEAKLAEVRALREPMENANAQSELDAEWEKRHAGDAGLMALIGDYSTADALVVKDPTNSVDKGKILSLLSSKGGSPAAKNARTYFSKFKRPIDAIDFIVADATLKNQKFKDEDKLDAEIGTLPEGDEVLSPEERTFFVGMTKTRARSALTWVEENLSEQANLKARELTRAYKKSNAKVVNKVISNAPQSTVIGKRAANAEEREAFEQELVESREQDVVENVAELRAAGVRAVSLGGGAELDALLSRSNAGRPPIVRRAAPPTRFTAEDELNLTLDEIFKISQNRVSDVSDLSRPLHPGIVRAFAANDLDLALRLVAYTAPNERIRKLALALQPYANGVEARLAVDLRTDDGRALHGTYNQNRDGSGREVVLDLYRGTDIETLLHEMVHAATLRALYVGTPVAKRIEKLFNDIKPKLSYKEAAVDVREFVSYALTDPKFKDELSRIYPDGSNVPAYRSFMNDIINMVRGFLGMQPRILGTAYDVTDQMVMEIIGSPANISEISSPIGANATLNRIAKLSGSFPQRTKEFREQFGDDTSRVLDGASWGAKRTILGFFGSQSLADVAAHYNVVGARDLQAAIDQHDAAAVASDAEVDAVLNIAEKWVKNNPNLKPILDKVVHRSTVEQVDPSLGREKAVKKYGEGSEKLRVYDEMQPDWARLSKDGHDLYYNMRQLYRKQYGRLRDALAGKIDFVLSDNPELAAEVKKSIYAKFFDMNQIDPYFPLVRKGDFWLEYSAFDPQTKTTEPVRETYESPGARDRAIKELGNIPGIVKDQSGAPITSMYTTMDLVTQGRTPDSLFVRDTLAIIQANLASTGVDAKTSESIQQEITQLFIQALPETSFAKSLQRRKNTKGYMEDAVEALRIKGYSLGRQGVRYKYSNKIRAISEGITEQAKREGNASKIAVIEELQARANFALNPPNNMFERAVQAVNRMAFAFTIGLNVSSALVNLSSIPVVVYPYLAGRYGGRAATVALGDAYKLFMNSGITREMELPGSFQGKKTTTVKAMPSMDNYFVLKENRTVDADGKTVVSHDYVLRDDTPPQLRRQLSELSTLVDVASKNGQLNRSIFYDSVGVENFGRSRTLGDRLTAISGAAFHQVERANRQVALIAAYKLELNRLRANPNPQERALTEEQRRTRAAERAVYQVTETSGGATLAAAPRWAQKNIGRVALMFKNYGLSMVYMQMKLIKQLTMGSNDPNFTPEDRRVAFRQLIGLQLSSFAMAGVAGMPIYGVASAVADIILGDDEEDADMLTRRYLGEGLYKGFLTEMSGLDISSRVGLTGLLIRENRYNSDPSAEELAFQHFGGPAWSTATRFGRGLSEFASAMTGGEGDMRRGIESMLPVGLSNVLKSVRIGSEGGDITTRRKDVIVDDLGIGELVGQALGFTPARATLQQDINQMKTRIGKKITKKRSDLGKAYYLALRVGDMEGAQEAIEDIRAFNESVREQFPSAQIDDEFIADSLRSHQKTSEQTQAGVFVSPVVRQGLDELNAQYNKGLQLF